MKRDGITVRVTCPYCGKPTEKKLTGTPIPRHEMAVCVTEGCKMNGVIVGAWPERVSG